MRASLEFSFTMQTSSVMLSGRGSASSSSSSSSGSSSPSSSSNSSLLCTGTSASCYNLELGRAGPASRMCILLFDSQQHGSAAVPCTCTGCKEGCKDISCPNNVD